MFEQTLFKTQSLVWASLVFLNEAYFLLLTRRRAKPAELSGVPNDEPCVPPLRNSMLLCVIPASHFSERGCDCEMGPHLPSYLECFRNRNLPYHPYQLDVWTLYFMRLWSVHWLCPCPARPRSSQKHISFSRLRSCDSSQHRCSSLIWPYWRSN